MIYAFWTSLLEKTDEFIDLVLNTPLTVQEWKKQKSILLQRDRQPSFDVGFAVFYVNRCSRSGILLNSGPIGGYKQEGRWNIDARFNRLGLVSRIRTVSSLKSKIEFYNMDAMTFMKLNFSNGKTRNKLVYLDPPYVSAGKRLYFNSFIEKDHVRLASYIQRHINLRWIITYDANDFIKNLYMRSKRFMLNLNHSLQTKHRATEYIFAGRNVEMPLSFKFNSKCIELEKH